MQVLFGPQHNGSANLNTHGAYEWWYVDALTPDTEWGIVVILFRGMPMSPEYILAQQSKQENSSKYPNKHCGYAVSVYHKGSRVFFGFGNCEEADCEFSSDGNVIRVGNHSLKRVSSTQYHFESSTCDTNAQRSASISALLHVPKPLANTPDIFHQQHGWVVASPRNRAEISVQLFEGQNSMVDVQWKAWAYHDHNMGRKGMFTDFGPWYWGRVLGDEGGFVYLGAGTDTKSCTLVELSEENDALIHTVPLLTNSFRNSIWGIKNASRLTIPYRTSKGVEYTLTTTNTRIVENGPFYQRYISEWWIDNRFYGYGTSEFMQVRRLQSPWIAPLLRLPWRKNV